ncbi:hypothetical protein AB0L70_22700 [Kribbella sp. NPDC051952]|uniref:hypothetical protein n=1 Tax=Kribbella sp. NPDC051952 TaxID=3154851 RepID=UPI0034486198
MTIDSHTDHAHGNHSDRPDPVLTPLSRPQATLLVQLGLDTATRLGLDLTYEGGAALVPVGSSATGPVLGLSNLARILARYDETQWPTLIDTHFTQLLAQLRHGPPTPPAHPEHDLIQRLVPRDALPADWTADRPDFVPGVLSVSSAVEDDVVTMYLEPSDLGLTWSAAESIGLTNLRGLTDQVEWVEHDDIRIAFVTGTAFAASRALVLDTVLRETLQLETPPLHGVLAAFPVRDVLMIHVIRDLSVIPALGLLLNLAARSYSHDPGPLSPDVHLVTPDFTWHPATTTSPDHGPLRLSPYLESLTKHLATREVARPVGGSDSGD